MLCPGAPSSLSVLCVLHLVCFCALFVAPSAAVITRLQSVFKFWFSSYLHPGVGLLDPMVLLCVVFFFFFFFKKHRTFWASFVAQLVKNPPAMWGTWVQSLGWEDPLEKGKATHSSILAWRIPQTV